MTGRLEAQPRSDPKDPRLGDLVDPPESSSIRNRISAEHCTGVEHVEHLDGIVVREPTARRPPPPVRASLRHDLEELVRGRERVSSRLRVRRQPCWAGPLAAR